MPSRTPQYIRDFVSEKFPIADPICRANGIPTIACLAQAALESGWGRIAPGNCFFGVKKWRKGQASTSQATTEVVNGKTVAQTANFTAYKDFADSVDGYCAFIHENRRYRNALANAADIDRYIREVAAAGYATDPLYADKVTRCARAIQLALADLNKRK